jgi:hypothetical protein
MVSLANDGVAPAFNVVPPRVPAALELLRAGEDGVDFVPEFGEA